MEIEKLLEYFETLVVTQRLIDVDCNLVFSLMIGINRDRELVRKSYPHHDGVKFIVLRYERYDDSKPASLYLEIHAFKDQDAELIKYLNKIQASVVKYEQTFIDFKIEFESFEKLTNFFSTELIHYI